MAHINIPLSGAVRKFPTMKFSQLNTLTLTLSENFPCKRHAMEELPFSLRSPNSRNMKKMALYCPQGSGTLRQQLLMMHGIAWHCMVLHGIALYCIVLHGIPWHCMVLHCIAWY